MPRIPTPFSLPLLPASYEFEIPKRYESSERRESTNSSNLGNVNAEIYRRLSLPEITVHDSTINDPPPLGCLSFQTDFEEYEGHFKVHVIGARGLPTRHAVSQVGVTSHGGVVACDPVLSVCLLPDEKLVLHSYVQHGTQEPQFDEVFVFKVIWTWIAIQGPRSAFLTLPLPGVFNVKFLLQPHQKYDITQYEERGFS